VPCQINVSPRAHSQTFQLLGQAVVTLSLCCPDAYLPLSHVHVCVRVLCPPPFSPRDVKPLNVIASERDGRLKLIDLGAAADLRTGTNYSPEESILDPMYCPPEQVCVRCVVGGGVWSGGSCEFEGCCGMQTCLLCLYLAGCVSQCLRKQGFSFLKLLD